MQRCPLDPIGGTKRPFGLARVEQAVQYHTEFPHISRLQTAKAYRLRFPFPEQLIQIGWVFRILWIRIFVAWKGATFKHVSRRQCFQAITVDGRIKMDEATIGTDLRDVIHTDEHVIDPQYVEAEVHRTQMSKASGDAERHAGNTMRENATILFTGPDSNLLLPVDKRFVHQRVHFVPCRKRCAVASADNAEERQDVLVRRSAQNAVRMQIENENRLTGNVRGILCKDADRNTVCTTTISSFLTARSVEARCVQHNRCALQDEVLHDCCMKVQFFFCHCQRSWP